MKTEFVMFHCYDEKKKFHDDDDCTVSFGLICPAGLNDVGLYSLCFKYVPESTVYIKFTRSEPRGCDVDFPVEIEEAP